MVCREERTRSRTHAHTHTHGCLASPPELERNHRSRASSRKDSRCRALAFYRCASWGRGRGAAVFWKIGPSALCSVRSSRREIIESQKTARAFGLRALTAAGAAPRASRQTESTCERTPHRQEKIYRMGPGRMHGPGAVQEPGLAQELPGLALRSSCESADRKHMGEREACAEPVREERPDAPVRLHTPGAVHTHPKCRGAARRTPT